VDARMDSLTFAISGRLAESSLEYEGKRVFNCLKEASELAELALDFARTVEPRGMCR
jgi:hypothetical protein